MTDTALSQSCGLSRRSFIKGAAALSAAGLLTGCSPQASDLAKTGEPAPETKIYSGACRAQCIQGCYLDVHVRDGQVVRTTAGRLPEPEYERICPKGLTQVARVYSSERLQYPLRRVGERGKGEFERISWDEAIQEIADKWKGYIAEFGPESIVYFVGSGNCALLGGGTADGSVLQRLRQVTGASNITTDRDMAVIDRLGKVFGYGGWGNIPTDFVNAKTFVIWGANPVVSEKQHTHFILDARDAGARVIDIDIAYNTVSSKADWFIPVHPATDGALALGAIREVLDRGWQDVEFLRNHTEAPFLIKEDGTYLRMSDLGVEPTTTVNAQGKTVMVNPCVVWDEQAQGAVSVREATKPALEGITSVGDFAVKTVYDVIVESVNDWTVERASEVSGVPADDIRELARTYALDGPVTTYAQYGLNHYNNGTYNYGPLFSLVLITGNMGKQGAGCGIHSVSLVGNSAGCLAAPSSTGEKPQGGGRNINWNQLYPIVKSGTKLGEPFVLKSLYASCTNPLCANTEHLETVALFKELEFIVVQEMTMTETARYADILLPVCHWFETVDLRQRAYNYPYLIWNEKAVEPLYESKPDFEIYKLIAEALGYGEFFDFTEEEYVERWLDSPAVAASEITLERLKKEKAVRFKAQEVGFKGGTFGTDTGRARFYQEKVVPDHNIGQTVDPEKERTFLYWEPALEADLSNPLRDRFPFTVCSEHMRTRTHSQWWDVGYLGEFEPYPIARLNPEDAMELGIAEGDKVRLYNDRGEVTMVATINAGQQRKSVHCPRSWQDIEFLGGNLSDLTFNDYNQACANQAYNDVAVAIEKL